MIPSFAETDHVFLKALLFPLYSHTHCSVEAIYPVQDPMALQDKRVASLVQYAMKVEKAMFEISTSTEEYYQLLAEKIYRIRKELEERRRVKNEVEIISRMRQGGGWL